MEGNFWTFYFTGKKANTVKSIVRKKKEVFLEYEGQYIKDKKIFQGFKKHGKGKYFFMNSDVRWKFIGTFHEDQPQKGKLFFHGGKIYDGELKDMKPDGVGKVTWESLMYKGEWKFGKYHGKGELHSTRGCNTVGYTKGWKYTGQFMFGKFMPRGKLVWKDTGDSYDGEFLYGAKHGMGRFIFKKAKGKYEGLVNLDNINGWGVYSFRNGDRYEGQFSNLCMSGNGNYYWKVGHRFVGKFKNNMPHGEGGVIFYKNGDKFDGIFENGKKCGKGKMMYYSKELKGWRASGVYKNDVREGEFKTTTRDGTCFIRNFKDGKIVGGVETVRSRDGLVYTQNIDPEIIKKEIEPETLATGKPNTHRLPWDVFLCGERGVDVDDKKKISIFYEQVRTELYKYGILTRVPSEKEGYFGERKSGKRTGLGVTFYPKSGTIHQGMYRKGEENGPGIMYFSSGSRYVGEFKNGLQHGKGVYLSRNGDFFDGTYKKGDRDGKGIYLDGEYHFRYNGSYKNGKRHGKGTREYFTGQKYVGEFRDDNYEGKGKIFFDEWGESGDGVFKDGDLLRGKYTWKSGTRYEGAFRWPDEHDKKGVWRLINGDYVVGEAVEGNINGKCTHHFQNGLKFYEGTVKKETIWTKEGDGIRTYLNGERYEGSYLDGEKSGSGVYYYVDGERYEGQFKDGMRHGNGVHITFDGTKVPVEYREGKEVGNNQSIQTSSTDPFDYLQKRKKEKKRELVINQRHQRSENVSQVPERSAPQAPPVVKDMKESHAKNRSTTSRAPPPVPPRRKFSANLQKVVGRFASRSTASGDEITHIASKMEEEENMNFANLNLTASSLCSS